MDTKNIGLRNIEVADTKISYIAGHKGKLIYRVFDILDQRKNYNFLRLRKVNTELTALALDHFIPASGKKVADNKMDMLGIANRLNDSKVKTPVKIQSNKVLFPLQNQLIPISTLKTT